MNGMHLGIPTIQEIQRFTVEVLRRPEFGRFGEDAGKMAEEPGWIFSWLDFLRNPALESAGAVLVRILLIVLYVALVFFFVRILLSGSVRWRAPRGGRWLKEPFELSGEPHDEAPEVTLGRAESALADGDIRSAIRALYTAMLHVLTRSGLVRLKCWKTSLAYLRECPKDANQYVLLHKLTGAYNAIVYGHCIYDKSEIAQFLSELRCHCGQG